jgi:uncharacterized protein (TIGR03083 family)
MREELLREQWLTLRGWLDDAGVLDRGQLPTGLGAWSVSDLVAHLGLGLGMLTEITPAQPGTEPMSFGRYVGHYPPAAEAIAAGTRDLAAELQPDLLAGLDRIAAEAFAAIEGVDWPVVLGRRGPLTYADYLQTRLLELVVHGDDLERAIDARTSPVVEEAAESVAATLADAYEERSGSRPDVSDPIAWIRLATGRVGTDDSHLPLL